MITALLPLIVTPLYALSLSRNGNSKASIAACKGVHLHCIDYS